MSDTPSKPATPWMTNGLLGAIVVLFGSGGVYTVGASQDLHSEVSAMRSDIALIAAHQESNKEWRNQHQQRPHDKASDEIQAVRQDQSSLTARVVALELALEYLSQQVKESRRSP